MRVISQDSPAPRLLNTVAPDLRDAKVEPPTGRFRLKGAAFFCGNGRAVFIGILLAAVALGVIGFFFTRYKAAQRERVSLATQMAASPETTPAPIMVNISPNALHVTAISMGQPRLAIINGQHLTEGDQITIPTLSASIAIKLRVLKILDGRVDLTDGTRVITARVEFPSAPPHKP